MAYLRGPAGGTAGVIHTKPQQIELLLKSRWASLWIAMEVRMAFSQCQEKLQSFMALLSNNDYSCKDIFPNKWILNAALSFFFHQICITVPTLSSRKLKRCMQTNFLSFVCPSFKAALHHLQANLVCIFIWLHSVWCVGWWSPTHLRPV